MSDTRTDYHYYEEVSAHPIFQGLIIAVLGVLVYLSVVIPHGVPRIVLGFVVVMLVFIYGNFMRLRVSISSKRLTVGYGIIQQSIRLDNIDYIETRRPAWYWYGGLGIRFGWDWSIGFIQNFKRGVRVTPKHGRRIFFSTENPEAVVNIVNDLIEKNRQ